MGFFSFLRTAKTEVVKDVEKVVNVLKTEEAVAVSDFTRLAVASKAAAQSAEQRVEQARAELELAMNRAAAAATAAKEHALKAAAAAQAEAERLAQEAAAAVAAANFHLGNVVTVAAPAPVADNTVQGDTSSTSATTTTDPVADVTAADDIENSNLSLSQQYAASLSNTAN